MLERIQFIKVNRNKRYSYTPRYYDERKERLEALASKYREEKDEADTATYRAQIKQRIEQSWDMNASSANAARAANVRLLIILVALLAGSYFILDYVDIFTSDITIID